MSSPGLSKAIHSIPERAGSLLHSEGQISLPVCSAGEAQIFAGTEKCPSFIILFLVGIAAEVRINSFKKKKKNVCSFNHALPATVGLHTPTASRWIFKNMSWLALP